MPVLMQSATCSTRPHISCSPVGQIYDIVKEELDLWQGEHCYAFRVVGQLIVDDLNLVYELVAGGSRADEEMVADSTFHISGASGADIEKWTRNYELYQREAAQIMKEADVDVIGRGTKMEALYARFREVKFPAQGES